MLPQRKRWQQGSETTAPGNNFKLLLGLTTYPLITANLQRDFMVMALFMFDRQLPADLTSLDEQTSSLSGITGWLIGFHFFFLRGSLYSRNTSPERYRKVKNTRNLFDFTLNINQYHLKEQLHTTHMLSDKTLYQWKKKQQDLQRCVITISKGISHEAGGSQKGRFHIYG